MELMEYQIDMRQFIVDSLNTTNKKIVVGMATGTGKTITAYAAIEQLLQQPNNRVLVLAHNQLTLRNNFTKQAYAVTPFEFKGRKQLKGVKAQRLVVTIPSTIAKCLDKIGAFTHIVIDEAHERYGKAEYQRIWETTGEPREILLTASHGTLIGTEYIKKTFSMMEGYKAGRISNLTSIGIQTPWDLTRDDYNSDGEIRGTKKITRDSVLEAVKDLIENYREYFRLESRFDKLKHQITNIKERFTATDFPKSIIACRDTDMCNMVYEYFNELIPGAVSLSHSLNPYDDEETLNSFDADETKRVIVVVKRANLGFDSPRTQVVVDMTGTRNPDRIMQLMGRVTRIHPQGKEKIFFKIVPEIFKVEMKRIWGVVFALGHPAYYATYDSTNYKDIPLLVERTKNGAVPTVAGGVRQLVDKTIEIKPLNNWMMNAALCWDYIEKLDYNDGETVAAYTRMTVRDLEKLDSAVHSPWLSFSTVQEFTDYIKYDLKINTYKEWRNQHNACYQAACRLNIRRDIIDELGFSIIDYDSKSKREEILTFFETKGRFPSYAITKENKERVLARAMSHYCSKTRHDYNEEFATYVNNLKIGRRIRCQNNAINKQLIVDFYVNHQMLPKGSDKPLYNDIRYYCSPSSVGYDPEFDKWARTVGYGTLVRDPDDKKLQIQQLCEMNGRLPSKSSKDPEEKKLYRNLQTYCNSKSSGFDIEFNKWARDNGYGKR